MLQSERIDNVFIEGSQEVAYVIQPRSQSGSSHCRSFAPFSSAHSSVLRAAPLPPSPALPVLPALALPSLSAALAALPLHSTHPYFLLPTPFFPFPGPARRTPTAHGSLGVAKSTRMHDRQCSVQLRVHRRAIAEAALLFCFAVVEEFSLLYVFIQSSNMACAPASTPLACT